MTLEFRKARVPEDVAELWKMDVEIFGEDAFDEDLWSSLESYWVVADGGVAGCTAFLHNVDFQLDVREDEQNTPQPGTLYIQSTGLLEQHRGQGLGTRKGAGKPDQRVADRVCEAEWVSEGGDELSGEQCGDDWDQSQIWVSRDTDYAGLLRGWRGNCGDGASVGVTQGREEKALTQRARRSEHPSKL